MKEKYRQNYIESENHAQDELDKTIIKLSAGSFAVTFAFVDNFIQAEPVLTGWLIASWLSWGLSIVVSLISYYLSVLAFRKAIEELDKGMDFKEVDPGGHYTKWLVFLNPLSLILFASGMICIAIFITNNL